ncbi:MAG: hypothetical protein LBI82_02340 [Dysgonamonadaceae bacterium]|nr:hypothetical protein [Dysgonamonadaceae bacterium]
MKKLFFLIFLVIFSSSVIAQDVNQTNSIAQYLDDGGRAKATNILKTDPVLIYQGTVPFIWEHLFSRNFSLEMGAGVVLPFYNRPLIYGGDLGQNSLKSPRLGGSLHLSPKILNAFSQKLFSNQGNGFEAYYVSFPLSLRIYPGQLVLFDGGLALGKQWMFDNRLTIDISAGIALTCQFSIDKKSYVFNAEDRYDYPENLGLEGSYPDILYLTFPISVKIGYWF